MKNPSCRTTPKLPGAKHRENTYFNMYCSLAAFAYKCLLGTSLGVAIENSVCIPWRFNLLDFRRRCKTLGKHHQNLNRQHEKEINENKVVAVHYLLICWVSEAEYLLNVFSIWSSVNIKNILIPPNILITPYDVIQVKKRKHLLNGKYC